MHRLEHSMAKNTILYLKAIIQSLYDNYRLENTESTYNNIHFFIRTASSEATFLLFKVQFEVFFVKGFPL